VQANSLKSLPRLLLVLTVLLSVGLPCAVRAESLPLPTEIPWRDDLDRMLERRQIRFLVVYNPMFYFLDGAIQRGVTVEMARLFEQELNRKFKLKSRPLHVVFIPVTRDELIPALLEGRGDIAAANITVTPERLKQVDFSDSLMNEVNKVVVTGPFGTEPENLEDMAGRMVFVRAGSSYEEHLKEVNQEFNAKEMKPMQLIPVAPFMEDSDLLEMTNAGLIPTMVVDQHKAAFWDGIFPNIRVNEEIAIHRGGSIGWAIRKNNPQLKAVVNDFVAGHRQGTLHGNILFKRYFKHNKWVRNNLAEKELEKFRALMALFRCYGERYQMDPLLLAAVGFQESGLDQSKVSERGAVGIMQLLPDTAADAQVGIEDIEDMNANIHAGTKYLSFLYKRYFADEVMTDLDKTLFTLAAYNAGPAKVRRLRKRADSMGLDASRWFGYVEIVAASLGWETVRYVANIYKYYTAYRLLGDRLVGKTP